MSHCKYNEWFCKLEIWIHHPQPSPHPDFWVVGGDDFGSSALCFTPRWSVFGLIQDFHSISTLPTSHYKYNEWLEKVEIGTWALKWSPQCVFQSWVGSKLAWPLSTYHTKIVWVWMDCGFHSISTLSMSHCKYNKWFYKLEIWIHHPQPSPHPRLLTCGWWQFWLQYPTFHTKMEYVWIDSRSSQHLNPSNILL